MPQEAHFDEKKLLYRLCYFLIEKRLSKEGKGLYRPITIELKEFCRVAHGYSDDMNNVTDHQITEFFEELKKMEDDEDKNNNQVIKIESLSDSNEDLINSFRNNKEITLRYKRRVIEDYLDEIRESDLLRIDTEKYKKLRLELIGDSYVFKYKGKKMSLKNSRIKIVLNICLLMFENQATFNMGDHRATINDAVNDYEIGEEIDIGDIIELLEKGEEIERTINYDRKKESIRVALYRINKRAKKELGREIFSHKNEQISIILDTN